MTFFHLKIVTLCIALLTFVTMPITTIAQQHTTGILNLSSTPPGAKVYVNKKLRGTTPVLLEVLAKSHRIELRLKGYETHTQTIVVKKNKVQRTSVTLRKKKPDNSTPALNIPLRLRNSIRIHSPAADSKPGTIFLATTPKGLTAYIDGFPVSKKTPVAFDIRPGIYELTLRNQRKEIVYQKTVFVRSGKTLDLDIIIQKKRTIDYSDPWK